MDDLQLEKLKYPIGKYQIPEQIGDQQIAEWIRELETLPQRVADLVSNFSEEQLETPYRPSGWTARQLIHHISDSHHNSYIRFKWALTEDNPVIKPYFEKRWSELPDAKEAPISLSLDHLRVVHAKLVYLLKRLDKDQLNRTFVHPDGNETSTLAENIGRYAWHGNHHYTHLANLKSRLGW